jgi:hypothetical protein
MKKVLLIITSLIMSIEIASADSTEAKEYAATIINLNGYLCAKVISIAKTGNIFDVACTENRDGTGIVSYEINSSSGRVASK